MKRDAVVNIFLIIVGILLALALFGAGAVWKGRMKPNRPAASAPQPEKIAALSARNLKSVLHDLPQNNLKSGIECIDSAIAGCPVGQEAGEVSGGIWRKRKTAHKK